MIRSLENLIGYSVSAREGVIGRITDFLVLDDAWRVRYIVVAAGGWLRRREILLLVDVVETIVDSAREVVVVPSRRTARPGAPEDEDAPAPEFHGGQREWSVFLHACVAVSTEQLSGRASPAESNPHLRSLGELKACMIGNPAALGPLTDLTVNDTDWTVNGIVAARNWTRSGPKVVFSPARITEIDPEQRLLRAGAGGIDISRLPDFNPEMPVNIARLVRHFDYYGRLQRFEILATADPGQAI